MITRVDKAQEISGLSERFGRAKAAFLVDFKGMSVAQVTDLRKKLHAANCEMRVVRNTLAIRALVDHPKSEAAIKDGFVGNNAIVFAYEDPSASAKALTDFAKDVEQLQVKLGVMEGTKLTDVGIKSLASLPSKDVLRAQLLGLMAQPATMLVRVLSAVPTGFARVLEARRDNLEKQGS